MRNLPSLAPNQTKAMSHKKDWSRVQNHDAARETWERVWGKKLASDVKARLEQSLDAAILALIDPPRAHTDTEAMSSSDPPKLNERADGTNTSTTA